MKVLGRLVLLLCCVGFLLVYYRLDPAQHSFFPKCPFLSLTGLFCPGCGSQRAIHALLHFDLKAAFSFNLLVPPALLALGYHLVIKYIEHVKGKNVYHLFYRPFFPIVLLAVVLVFTVLRNLPYAPFEQLAP